MKDEKLSKTPKVAMLELYDALEKKLKRHRPREYIGWMAKRLAESWDDPKKFVQTPPHRIMHSIEANCAYWKQGYADPVEWNAVAKIMNTYNDWTDPFQLSTISENLSRFFLMLRREQIELQQRPSWAYIMRVWRLFARSDSMQKSNAEFKAEFGLAMDQWVKLCFICWLISIKENGNFFLIKNIPDPSTGIGRGEFNAFLKYSARSPSEIGRHFLQIRKDVPYELHSLIRSAFLETPIVWFEDETMIVPHTHLLFRHAGEGLYRLSKELTVFNDEFGESFAEYVQMVLGAFRGPPKIIGSKQLEKIVKGKKSCDFLVEMKDAVILVECKACSFTANQFSDNAIKSNNSTTKVAKGLTQLYATAKNLEDGLFDQLNVDKNKPTVGIVVTFGEIPSANSDWYFQEFFLKQASDKLTQTLYPSKQMIRRPIVLDIQTLEKLVACLNTCEEGLIQLYDEKMAQNYHTVGDWETWLHSRKEKKDSKDIELLISLKEDKKEFLSQLDLPYEKFPD
jgi:hypothetical protein